MPLTDKERAKARNARRPVSWYLTWSVLTIAIISILSGFMLSLPIWQISSVKVAGLNYLPEAKMISTAKIPQGENIFLIDLDEAKARFSNVVQIKEIKIKRKLPSTIVIEIKERAPYAIVVIGGATSLVDEDGYIIAGKSLSSSIYRLDISKYPVIRGVNKNNLEKGMRLDEKDRVFVRAALKMLSKFIDISAIQIEVGDREDIVIYIEDILKVKIGAPSDIERKIKIIKAIRDSVQGKWTKLSYIDVRVPDDPVIKFR